MRTLLRVVWVLAFALNSTLFVVAAIDGDRTRAIVSGFGVAFAVLAMRLLREDA
jgi:hypothetical protein